MSATRACPRTSPRVAGRDAFDSEIGTTQPPSVPLVARAIAPRVKLALFSGSALAISLVGRRVAGCVGHRGPDPGSSSSRERDALHPIVEGASLGPDDLFRFVALAREEDGVARLCVENRALDGAGPVELDRVRRPRAEKPGSMARTMASGSSLRGLSLVTMAREAPRATAAPIFGRLSGSRSPPQPKTQMSSPSSDAANGREHALEGVRRVRVVAENANVVAIVVAALEAPGHLRGRPEGACGRLGLDTEPHENPEATSRFSRLCSPTSRESRRAVPRGVVTLPRMPRPSTSTLSGRTLRSRLGPS
jgi:hypothetical protein